MQDFIKVLLTDRPHLGIPMVHQAHSARFAGRTIPGQSAVRRYVGKWREEHKSLIQYVTSFDAAITDMGILDAKILLRLDEVAAILRVSLSQVYAMIDQGDLETTRTKPKRIKNLSVKSHLNDHGIL